MQGITHVALITEPDVWNDLLIPNTFTVVKRLGFENYFINGAYGDGRDYHDLEDFIEMREGMNLGDRFTHPLVIFSSADGIKRMNSVLNELARYIEAATGSNFDSINHANTNRCFDAVMMIDDAPVVNSYRINRNGVPMPADIRSNARFLESAKFDLSSLELIQDLDLESDGEDGEVNENLAHDNIVDQRENEVDNVNQDIQVAPVNDGVQNLLERENIVRIADQQVDVSNALNPDRSLSRDAIRLILEEIKETEAACVYDGFNTEKIRKKFISNFNDAETYAKSLIDCFIGYAHTAKNYDKLHKKRAGSEQAVRLYRKIAAMNVKINGELTNDSLTLPRIAIAFMPEYLLWRRVLAKKLTSHTDKISVDYQDIAFSGCEIISSLTGYAEFNLSYSSKIKHTVGEKGKRSYGADVNNEEFKKEVESWTEISKRGYVNEKESFKNRMTEYMTIAKDEELAVRKIVNSYVFYSE